MLCLKKRKNSLVKWLTIADVQSIGNPEDLNPYVEEVLKELPLKVEQYQNGKEGIINLFVGEVVKRTSGRANPRVTNELFLKKLSLLKHEV